jgi:hypothetical protein
VLTALVGVPLAYWIIKAIPPAPQRLFFPATWLTRKLDSENTTSQSAPWWLIALRLLMLTCLIFALADPSLRKAIHRGADGPVILVIDNDWSAAADWEERTTLAKETLGRFKQDGRAVAIVPTAPPLGGWPKDAPPLEYDIGAATQSLAMMHPQAWGPDYDATLAKVRGLTSAESASTLYLTSGIDHGNAASALAAIDSAAPLEILALHDAGLRQVAIANVRASAAGFDVLLVRREGEPALSVGLGITDDRGTLLARESVRFERDVAKLDTRLTLPVQLRGRVAKMHIEGTRHAAATYVFDARAQRPLVGIVSAQSSVTDQPLQTPYYYLSRALQPFATLERGAVPALLKQNPSVMLLPDQGRLALQQEQAMLRFVGAGGTLIRFAGPNLFASDDVRADALLPTSLRPEPRVVGGALSWSAAQPIAPFPADSPFFGIPINDDIRVERQALVRTGGTQQTQIWARLADGTPLITARAQGSGTLVFFHTSANAAWSNLALSGTFVEMLQRLLQISNSGAPTGSNASELMTLTKRINGFGQLVNSSLPTTPIARSTLSTKPSGAALPPGLYEGQRTVTALNMASNAGPITPRTRLKPLKDAAGALPYRVVDGPQERSLRGFLLVIVFILALIDVAATFLLHSRSGFKPPWRTFKRAAGTSAILLAFTAGAAMAPKRAQAQAPPNPAELTENVRLACLRTAAGDIDALCLKGLNALSRQLNMRTSVWTGEAQSVAPTSDNLGVYPLIYWPISAETRPLSAQAYENLAVYMRSGGMLVIDLGLGVPGQVRMDVRMPGADILADIRRNLALPPLADLTKDHVLTHSFYILQTYPGRRGSGTVWVEAGGEEIGADVSPIIIGAADWLTAWASVQSNLPGYANGDGRKGELAIRYGINLVMYALTGTYKADQVHLPALLERVGRED